MQAIGKPTEVEGMPVQRFVKRIIPQGHFVKRDKVTKEKLWELDVTRKRQDMWVDAFKAMKTDGVAVRLLDETGNYTIDAPKAPLSKNHAGAFEKNPQTRLKKLAEAVVGETVDMFVEEEGDFKGWLSTVHEVKGKEQIELCKTAKFTSPEIDPCFIDGTDKKHGEAITAISIVANPLVPGQTGFQPIAASADSPERYVLSLENEEPSMALTAALIASIAMLAGVDASQVTDDSAPGLLKGVHTKLTETTDKLTKALSADEPDTKMLGLTARNAETVIKQQLTGILSEAGIQKVTSRLVGDRAAGKYSSYILSADSPDGAIDFIEQLCKDIKDNIALKKGVKTELQDDKSKRKALSEDEGGTEENPAHAAAMKIADAHIQSHYGIKPAKKSDE